MHKIPPSGKIRRILRKCANILLVDDEHRKQFAGKGFVSFRRAKNLKDTLVRAKLQTQDQELEPKGTFKCSGKRCQICPIIQEGYSCSNANDSRSFKNFSRAYDCNSANVVYMCQCTCCSKKYVGITKTKFCQRINLYKSYFRTYKQKRNAGTLDTGKAVRQASFFSHFFEEGHHGEFSVVSRLIDGSLRREGAFLAIQIGFDYTKCPK